MLGVTGNVSVNINISCTMHDDVMHVPTLALSLIGLALGLAWNFAALPKVFMQGYLMVGNPFCVGYNRVWY